MTVNEMQFCFMPEKGTMDFVFVLKRLQEEYHAKWNTFYVCFVHIEKVFNSVPKNVLESAMMKKGIPETILVSKMSLYERGKKRVRVDFMLLVEFEVNMELETMVCTWKMSLYERGKSQS